MPKKTVSIINLLLPAAGSIVVKDTGIPPDIGTICRRLRGGPAVHYC
jgi:hypothetical protein